MAVNKDDITYEEGDELLKNGTGAEGSAPTDTGGLLSSNQFTQVARRAADKNYKVQTGLAKTVFDETYKALDDAYGNAEEAAGAAKRRSLVDADSSYKLSELKYGAEQEALAAAGLSGSGLSEYQKSQAYAQNRADRQATYAEYDKALRDAAYSRDLGKADAEIRYAQENAAAQIEYNNAMAQIGEQGLSYAMLEKQEVDAAYRGYIDGIKNGAMTLEQVMADSYWSKLTDAQRIAVEGAEKVKILQNKINGSEDGIAIIQAMEGFSELTKAQQSEVIADYYNKHALGATDANAASSDYLAMVEAGIDINNIEAYARNNGHLEELIASGTWERIKNAAGDVLSTSEVARETVYNDFIDSIRNGTRTLSQIKATTSYQKLIKDNPDMAEAIKDEFARVGLAIIETMEQEYGGLMSKGSIISNLLKYGYATEDANAVIEGWQKSNFEQLKSDSDLTEKEINAALFDYEMISEDQAKELREIVGDRESSASSIPYEANKQFDKGGFDDAAAYLKARGNNDSANSVAGGWYIDGMGAGRAGDTFKITIGDTQYNEEAYTFNLKSAGPVSANELKAINYYFNENGLEKPSADNEAWDLSITADHTISSEDEGKSSKLIVLNGEMYLYAKKGWVRLVERSTGEKPTSAIAQYLRESDKKRIEEYSGGYLTEQDFANPERTAEKLISQISTADDVVNISKMVNALTALQDNAKLYESTKEGIKNTLTATAKNLYAKPLYTEDEHGKVTTSFQSWDEYLGYKAAIESLKDYATYDEVTTLNNQLAGAAGAVESMYIERLENITDIDEYIEAYNELQSLHGKGIDSNIKNMKKALGTSLVTISEATIDRIDAASDIREYASVREEIDKLKPYITEKEYNEMMNRLKSKTNVDTSFDLKNSGKKKGSIITDPSTLAILNSAIDTSKSGQTAMLDGKQYYYAKGIGGNFEWYELKDDSGKTDILTEDSFVTNADGSTNYTYGKVKTDLLTGKVEINSKKMTLKNLDDQTNDALKAKFPEAEGGDYVELNGKYYVKRKTEAFGFTIEDRWMLAYDPLGEIVEDVTNATQNITGALGSMIGVTGTAPKDYAPSADDKKNAYILDEDQVVTKREGNMQVKTTLNGTNQVTGVRNASAAQKAALKEKFGTDLKANTYVVMGGYYFVTAYNYFGNIVWKRVSVN